MNNEIDIKRSSKSSANFSLSKAALKDYKTAYLQEYGIDLTDEEAHFKALNLLTLIKLVYKPIPKEAIK